MLNIPEELKNQESKEKNNAMLKRFIIGLVGIFLYSIIRINEHNNPGFIDDLFVKGHFVRTGDVNYIHRFGASATLLKDGRVLVVGGDTQKRVKEDPDVAGSEIYNPKIGKFYPLGNTIYPRTYHAATLLNDGRVLITGSLIRGYGNTAEVFSPETNTFHSLGNMPEGYAQVPSTLLKDGRVLFGEQIFDPVMNKFYMTGKMNYFRREPTATLLKDGRVLITGGDVLPTGGITSTAEIYDPDTGRYTLTGSMSSPRVEHTAALLPDGRVLIAGGFSALLTLNPNISFVQAGPPEIYNPVTGEFKNAEIEFYPYTDINAVLKDGKVLLTVYDEEVSAPRALVYDSRTGKYRLSGRKHCGETTELLQNGNVLFFGGDIKKAELYVP